MFNSVILSIAITLVFIFLLLSVMVTAFNELFFTVFRMRSKQLEGFLSKLFFNDIHWDQIFEQVKDSPFINVLKKSRKKFPAAIPAESFTTALLAHIGEGSITIEAIKKAVDKHKDSKSDFYSMMRTLLSENPTIEELRAEIDKVFGNAMDRLTGWYKRNAKIWSFWVALFICSVLNVDTITMTRNLWNDKDKAEQMASFAVAASKYFEKNDSSQVIMTSGIDTLAYMKVENKALAKSGVTKMVNSIDTTTNKEAQQQIVRSYGVISSMDLPIGWLKENMPVYSGSFWNFTGAWFMKVLGILLSTLAVFLGAPFWFDVLNRITPLKGGKSGGSGKSGADTGK